jgi:hypothetical protein
MALLAEAILAEHRTGGFAGVASDAFVQTGLFTANPLTQSPVTLVLEHVHVVTAHLIGWGDATTRIFDLDRRLWCTSLYQDRSEQQGCRQPEKCPFYHSETPHS